MSLVKNGFSRTTSRYVGIFIPPVIKNILLVFIIQLQASTMHLELKPQLWALEVCTPSFESLPLQSEEFKTRSSAVICPVSYSMRQLPPVAFPESDTKIFKCGGRSKSRVIVSWIELWGTSISPSHSAAILLWFAVPRPLLEDVRDG